MTLRVAGINLEWDSLELERELLEPAGATIEAFECDTEESIVTAADGAVAILAEIAPITRQVLEQLPACRLVVFCGVGAEYVDFAAAAELGMWVTNVPDYCTGEVADHTLALALTVLRRIPEHRELVRAGSWNSLAAGPVPRLADATWGVVGFGRIGRAVASRAAALGCRILAADPHVPAEEMRAAGAEPTALAELLSRSDVVSLHSPRTPETIGMIGAAELALLRPTAVLVNVARGHLIDEAALVAALDAGALAGAGLDVLTDSPPRPDHPLIHHPRAIVTPHMAWYSVASAVELRRKSAQAVVDVLAGRRPRYVVAEPVGR